MARFPAKLYDSLLCHRRKTSMRLPCKAQVPAQRIPGLRVALYRRAHPNRHLQTTATMVVKQLIGFLLP